jgi:hypothetical protein
MINMKEESNAKETAKPMPVPSTRSGRLSLKNGSMTISKGRAGLVYAVMNPFYDLMFAPFVPPMRLSIIIALPAALMRLLKSMIYILLAWVHRLYNK